MVPDRHHAAAAGYQRTRRLFLCAVLAVVAAGVAAAPADSRTTTRVDVTESGGVYRVTAAFAVTEAPHTVFEVLTDYDRIPKFMPDVQVSQVLERSATGAVVEQEAVSRFMMFSKRVHLVLDIQEDNGTIRFRDRCGRSFVSYEGAWIITEQDSVTVVDYRLTARPTFEVPAFVLKRLLKRDAALLIDRLKAEIASRADRGQ